MCMYVYVCVCVCVCVVLYSFLGGSFDTGVWVLLGDSVGTGKVIVLLSMRLINTT